MSTGEIFFHVLLAKDQRRGTAAAIVILEWSPVEVRVDLGWKPKPINDEIASWADSLGEDVYHFEDQVPSGLSSALVRMWSSRGMDDYDCGSDLIAIQPMGTPAHRHLLSDLLTKRHERDHSQIQHWKEMNRQLDKEIAKQAESQV